MSRSGDHSSGGAAGNGNGGASEAAVSRFAGHPGTLTALRVDYSTRDRAFAPHAPSTHLGKVREEVKQLSSGPRLGDRALWSTSSSTQPLSGIGAGGPIGSVHYAAPTSSIGTAIPGLPQRPQMSQNSAYQAVKLNYNYRASALPPVKEVLYIPKHNKLEVDKTVFLRQAAGKNATTVIADKCLTTATNLSRCENQNNYSGKRSGEVHPLVDTFGAHNVRRHMVGSDGAHINTIVAMGSSMQHAGGGGGNTNNSSILQGYDDEGNPIYGSGSGAYGGSHSFNGPPPTLRNQTDIDVYYYVNSQQQQDAEREAGWNTSSQMAADRTNIYKLREYKDYRAINKAKEGRMFLRPKAGGASTFYSVGGGASSAPATARNDHHHQHGVGAGGMVVDPDVPISIDVPAELSATKARLEDERTLRHGVYTTPLERQKQISATVREGKLAKREAQRALAERQNIDALTLRGGGSAMTTSTAAAQRFSKTSVLSGNGSDAVFKMSNKEEWWSALPEELERCRAQLAASHVKATDTFGEEEEGAAQPGAPAKPPKQVAEAPQLDASDDDSDDSDAE